MSMGPDDTDRIICLFPLHLPATEGGEREQLPRALKSPLNCKTSASRSDLAGLLLFFLQNAHHIPVGWLKGKLR